MVCLAGNGRSGKSESAPPRATDSSFSSRPSRMSLPSTSQLYRPPLGCEPPSNPTSTLTPAAPFGALACPAQTLLTAREFHDLLLLACAGMAVNIHCVHPEQAELLLDAAAAPAVRFRSADAARPRAAGWCSRATSSRATRSPPLTTIKGSLSNSTR